MSKTNPTVVAGSVYSDLPNDMQRRIYNAGFVDMDHRHTKSKSSTLIDRVSLLGSTPGIFDPSEWRMTGAEYCSIRTSCICGQSGLKHRYILTNSASGHSISVGGNCLHEHFGIEPQQELIDFSRDHGSSQYVWLGQKYDAFIFYSLGFKRSFCYFRMRQHKQIVPAEYNKQLRDDLAVSLYVFNFSKWQQALERGRRLYERIHKKFLTRQYTNIHLNAAQSKNNRIEDLKRILHTTFEQLGMNDSHKTLNEAFLPVLEQLLKKINEYASISNGRLNGHPFVSEEQTIIDTINQIKQESENRKIKIEKKRDRMLKKYDQAVQELKSKDE